MRSRPTSRQQRIWSGKVESQGNLTKKYNDAYTRTTYIQRSYLQNAIRQLKMISSGVRKRRSSALDSGLLSLKPLDRIPFAPYKVIFCFFFSDDPVFVNFLPANQYVSKLFPHGAVHDGVNNGIKPSRGSGEYRINRICRGGNGHLKRGH